VLDLDVVRDVLAKAHAKRNPEKVEKNDRILDRGLADGAALPWRPARPYELTDEGLSQRLLDEHGHHLRYVTEWGKWIGYDGKSWRLAGDTAPAMLSMRDLTTSLRDEAEYVGGARGKALQGAARKCASASGAASVVRMASPLPRFRIGIDALDPAPMLLGCANGVIDLGNGALHEHHPSHLITSSTHLAYDADAMCPRWDRFMREVCCDDLDLVRYLQRAIGYTLTAHTTEHALFFLYGGGANGKSTFLNVLGRLLGEYATTCSAELVLAKKHEQHPTAIAALYGKRLAIVGEVDDGRAWDEATVKNLTGGDVITARRMREDNWLFRPIHKLWIAGNYRPGVRGCDNGIWRRMRLIPFEANFHGNEDRHLMAKLTAELPGILAWAVRGCVAWQREGLEMPQAIAKATSEYRDEQNFFGAFAEECLEVVPNVQEHQLSRAQVVQMYTQWAIRNGAPTLGARAIAERLRAVGPVGEHRSNGVVYWTCLRVRPRNLAPEKSNAPN
jgi:putative DNA primase/helicase